MSKTIKKKGRPEKPENEQRKHCISVWLDADGKERIKKAAKSAGDASGRWLGKVGDEAARRALAAMGMS
jgi:hypothetical protein